ncbi:Coenzyme A biosynthesis bifunctional protein CoaBC [Frondihabitans sp. 762G35]|uniref:bifunctional phosphopantothenoylcysteine decarboxylase/phosphopantothenate--cysteine ligase CoaBC n=1 Tax=Frondihabitans sp. 762G35 TaxID=1446794 RepID=UPI000D22585E|nr:bifunctional phosphopantothenoylcysteine decarboxylase/phosphopantothenate--cysteine ligase CoaBC [Frondihabitans sp. 762G35]ARC57801.1 Coenzyme A biosynthesis bifunctional protein CoaBC [Frondihabitans sp. 762G35]
MGDRLNIVVGITGGIAAYKAATVVRLLVKAGHDVHVVPTESALRFVGAPTLEALSRNPVTTSIFDDVAAVRHVALGQAADLVVIAPATANSLAKLAAGMADDLLGTTVLASRAPLVVAPAMHTEMWSNPATVANVATLRSRGVVVVGPASGELTGGDRGPGRLSEPEEIVAAALAAVVPARGDLPGRDLAGHDLPGRDLAGRHVVVTAGGTREPLDPVRFLGNRSSGRQGVALARAAADRGARVTLVAAHLDADVAQQAPGTGITVVEASTTRSLQEAVTAAARDADVVVMAAAVADYRPERVADAKIKKAGDGADLTLRLVENPDVLRGLVETRRPGQIVVGFAAETAESRDELLALGRAKAERKGADLLVLNTVGWSAGFGTADNDVVVLDASGTEVAAARGSKREVAEAVLDEIVGRLLR